MDTQDVAEIVPLGMEAQQQLVLRAIVEDFGGEVTGTALARHLSLRSGRRLPASGLILTDVLQSLHRLGALSLEDNGGNDLIVRLLPGGAELYL